MAETTFTVAYWGCQGLVHPVRLLLNYYKVQFEDKQYMDRESWFETDKPKLNTPLKSIPYIVDGDVVVTESFACFQYAALKTGNKDLLGKNDLDAITVSQYYSVGKDIANAIGALAWNKDFETVKDETIKTKIAPLVEKLSKALGEKEYMLGYLTWVDFQLTYLFEIVKRLSPETVTAHANLVKYHDRIYNHENLQAYRKSEKYPKFYLPPVPGVQWSGEEKL